MSLIFTSILYLKRNSILSKYLVNWVICAETDFLFCVRLSTGTGLLFDSRAKTFSQRIVLWLFNSIFWDYLELYTNQTTTWLFISVTVPSTGLLICAIYLFVSSPAQWKTLALDGHSCSFRENVCFYLRKYFSMWRRWLNGSSMWMKTIRRCKERF